MKYTKLLFALAFAASIFVAPSFAQESEPAPQPQDPPSFVIPFHIFVEPQEPSPEELEEFYRSNWSSIGDIYYAPDKLKSYGEWEHKYDGKLTTVAELEQALKELAASFGDRWTRYTTTSEIAASRQQYAQNIAPIGMELKRQTDGSFRVHVMFWGSPAQKSDLRIGDTIKSVGGKELAGMSEDDANQLTSGKIGEKLAVEYMEGGKPVKIELTFEQLKMSPVESRMLSDGVLYIRLPTFNSKPVLQEFEQALTKAVKDNGGKLSGLVLDLRGNTGGVFDYALQVVSDFQADGVVTRSVTRNGRMVNETTHRVIPYLPHMLQEAGEEEANIVRVLQSVPMVVLADHNTMSASEVTIGALKDNGRVRVVGEPTFGKAVGYKQFRLRTGGVMQVTTLKYLTPKGHDVSQHGIVPDRLVRQPRGTEDVQLKAGVEELTRLMKKGGK